ncbi:GGDEF domain-containing protein [Psychrobacter sp. PL19]
MLLGALTNQAIVSRYGGEEFLIVLPNTEHDSAMAIAETLRKNIAQHVTQVDDDISVQVTASLGLYTLTYNELININRGYTPTAHIDSSQLTSLQRYKARKNKPEAAKHLDRQTLQLFSDICQYLISTADKALYKAKDRGRNQVVSANDLLAEGSIPKSRT